MKIEDKLYKVTSTEITQMKPSDFGNGSKLYVTSKTGKIKYIIELNKGIYKTFSLKTRVMDADSFKYLTTPGAKKGMRPYYIDDFIHRN